MGVLVLVEHDNQTMHGSTRHVLTAALQLHQEVTMLVVGHQCHAVAEAVASLQGVSQVMLCDDVVYQHPLAEPLSELLCKLAPSFSHVLCVSSTFGKNILPRLAAMLDVAQLSDLTRIINTTTYEHPIYAGNAIEVVELLDTIHCLTVRETAFDPVLETQTPSPIEILTDKYTTTTAFIDCQLHVSTRPDLKNASIVVSGGRGLQGREQFKMIEALADALGAAIGASRAAVDAGFVSNDYQVGQTGKIVAPKLYIAIGISGAVQHMAGMKDSKVIVAINQDPDAPIFQIATYGLVGDLFKLVPELMDELKKRGISIC